MARYIDKDVVLKDIRDAFSVRVTAPEKIIVGIIRQIPTADVQEVKFGEWLAPQKVNPFYDWRCSVCGCEEYRQVDSQGKYRRMNYCPNCGAKMKEG